MAHFHFFEEEIPKQWGQNVKKKHNVTLLYCMSDAQIFAGMVTWETF